jgi:ketosteroid isomerase-like protein
MKTFFSIISTYAMVIFFTSCTQPAAKNNTELKEELKKVENAFSDSSFKKGFYHALLDFAADDIAMFQTGDTVIKGWEYIKTKVDKFPVGTKPPFILTWEPEKIEVAASGDLGYTYGWYVITNTDSAGNKHTSKGLYNSFWRKVNGTWKLVLD